MARGTWQGSGTWQTNGPDLTAIAGPAVLVVAAAAAVTVIAQIIVWLAVIVGILVAAAIAALVLVWRRTRQREAVYGASPQHQRLIAATATPQVTQGAAPPAIEYHVHNHYHAAEPGAARVIPGRVLP